MTSDSSSAPPSPSGAPARLHIDDSKVAWIHLDDPGKAVNTMSSRLFEWFQDHLPTLAGESLRGVVVISDKPDHFMAGADIDELEELADSEQVYGMLTQAHDLFRQISALPYPVVAAVHGACLGGGLELAMTCDWFVATDHPKTRLGLPEVQLGIFPGMGGTQRLPRRVGVAPALDMILTGRQIGARRGERLGLVDRVCSDDELESVAVAIVESGTTGPRHQPRGLANRLTQAAAKTPFVKKLIFDRARRGVLERTGGHYPSPLEAIRVVEEGLAKPLDRGLDIEARAFSEIVVSDKARKLMGIFFMKNDVEARAARVSETAHSFTPVGILGAGFMGSGIAQVLAQNGYAVIMKDRDQASVDRGLSFCRERFSELERRRRLDHHLAQAGVDRVRGTIDYRDFRKVPFVIEAVFENIEVKHKVIHELEAVTKDSSILASNTSAIPITRLAEASRRPENFSGIHFFSPVHRMPLVEVIRTTQTSATALATTVEVGRRMGKTVIVVNDGPGFFTTRVLAPFINEAAWILSDGASVEQIDHALAAWGWPVGPMALLDEVGLDVAHHAGGVLVAGLGHRLEPPPAFDRMIAEGRTGRKGGRGFYVYPGVEAKADETKHVDDSLYELLDWEPRHIKDEEIADRCWLQMLNEVARCIEDGIIENPKDIDIGVIFGFGFPPFRGGILRQADDIGLDAVVGRLEEYVALYGERLEPAYLLRDMARAGRRFHHE